MVELKDYIENYIYTVYPERKQNQDHIRYSVALATKDDKTITKITTRLMWINSTIEKIKSGKKTR